MKLSPKIWILLLGDVVILYLSLFVTLLLRYREEFYVQFNDYHKLPFGIIFVLWILIFYVAGLYDLRHLRNNIEFLKKLSLAILVGAFAALAFFYLVPIFGITPRTNLFIFIVMFAFLESLWRRFFNRTISGEAPNRALLIGNDPTAEEISAHLKENPQHGYAISLWLKKDLTNTDTRGLREVIARHGINLVIIPRHFTKNDEIAKSFYELLGLGIEIRDLTSFYELIFRKVPLANLEESWFLENAVEHKKFYDELKRALEFLFALALGVFLIPLEVSIAILIKLTSRGPVIYKQERIGKNNKPFTLYKFRTMRKDAEQHGARWSGGGDARVTSIGKILRYTHLDELPQLLNILKGDVSFVGPRPERPEFTRLLSEKIPYYEIRHLIIPGITGWAQINYRYGSSVEDAYEKLQYDIFYLKNRSLVLDAAIILKTLKSFFVNPHTLQR